MNITKLINMDSIKNLFLKIVLFSSLIVCQNEVCFEIESNPVQNQPGFSYFTKYVNVLNCFEVFAPSNISDEKVLHVAAIVAELLDNDEDGNVDDPLIAQELASKGALMPIFTSENSQAANNFFNNYNGEGVSAILFNNEIDPSQPGHWGDDATVEEVVHTINHVGHINIYPEVFDIDPNSSLMSDAMDLARGGQFLNIPNQYPDAAWYHYDDWTCDYGCMAIEYLYWCIVSHMGILNDTQTCSGINNEWELCSPVLFETIDISMHSILTNPEFMIPQLAPDGNYCPNVNILGDINLDGTINILDVILTVNIILGLDDYDAMADLNTDGMIDVLDVVLILNIILN